MNYPKQLVDLYGGKAGFLMYVAEQLPDIPQAKSVSKTLKDDANKFIRRCQNANLGKRMLVRASAREEVFGYEGKFPTVLAGRNAHPLESAIEFVENSPKRMKENIPEYADLPDKIPLIVVEEIRSKYKGTIIGHPNQDILIATLSSGDPACRFFYHHTIDKDLTLKNLNFNLLNPEDTIEYKDQYNLIKIATWYSQITALPKLDPEWTYQLEFSIDPTILFQVRPFRKKSSPDFSIESNIDSDPYLVIGCTTKEGIDLRVETDTWEKEKKGLIVNEDHAPSVFVDSRHVCTHSEDIPNIKASLLRNSYGMLAHNDVGVMRSTPVVGLFPGIVKIKNNTDDNEQHYLTDGSWIHLTSDGKNIKIDIL